MSIQEKYFKQQFNPTLLSVFINPFYFVRKSIYDATANNAKELSGVMLDFGCGSKPYYDLFKLDKYVGLDVEQSGHSHEKEPIDVFYDGRDIPFEDNHFDSCFSSQVFEHVFDLDYSLKEINRVLKPNGKCLFIVPFVWDEHEVPYDFARYSSFGLTHLFNKHGFEIVKHQKDSYFFKVMVQLWCLYIHNLTRTKNKYLNLIMNAIFISPFTIVGLILNVFAPKNDGLYFNNVFIVQKKKSKIN